MDKIVYTLLTDTVLF